MSFNIDAQISTIDYKAVRLSFWSDDCRTCTKQGLITKQTTLFNTQGKELQLNILRPDVEYKAYAIMYGNSSSKYIQSIYLVE